MVRNNYEENTAFYKIAYLTVCPKSRVSGEKEREEGGGVGVGEGRREGSRIGNCP